ncbi:hypothetical protein EV385_0470 [Krasilnikovia cinnamomea]|uniref:Uncharacterized protein n=1 Tax=Krasilnikovia cinnamomea TaxID=349313 RepID=A0A4V6MG23_9ACTN|nr:hypothetical protein EV385_0470 [Krasilnikovia cinnamomea]
MSDTSRRNLKPFLNSWLYNKKILGHAGSPGLEDARRTLSGPVLRGSPSSEHRCIPPPFPHKVASGYGAPLIDVSDVRGEEWPG